jgi:negative regulator of replication initiation
MASCGPASHTVTAMVKAAAAREKTNQIRAVTGLAARSRYPENAVWVTEKVFMAVLLVLLSLNASCYSRASASTGSRAAALRAGSQPNTRPIRVDTPNAARIDSGE